MEDFREKKSGMESGFQPSPLLFHWYAERWIFHFSTVSMPSNWKKEVF